MFIRSLSLATKKFTFTQNSFNMARTRVFSTTTVPPNFSDIGDIMKVNYTVEFDQGFTDE